jgi:hypothetical protein
MASLSVKVMEPGEANERSSIAASRFRTVRTSDGSDCEKAAVACTTTQPTDVYLGDLMSIEINKRIAEDFIRGLRTRDGKLLHSIMKEHVVWSLPGNSLMSGEAHGVEAILKRSEILGRFGVTITVDYVLYGFRDVALSLHNTGELAGKVL